MSDGPFHLGFRGDHADLWLGDRLLIDVLGWEAAAACLDRAIGRLDAAFHPPGRDTGPGSLDHLLFEGGPFYAKRDGMSGLPMWLYLGELLRAASAITPERRLVLGRVAPPVWVAGLRDALGLAVRAEPGLPAPDPAELYRGERSGDWWTVPRGSLRPLVSKLGGLPRGAGDGPLLMLSLRDWDDHGFGYMVGISKMRSGFWACAPRKSRGGCGRATATGSGRVIRTPRPPISGARICWHGG